MSDFMWVILPGSSAQLPDRKQEKEKVEAHCDVRGSFCDRLVSSQQYSSS